MKMCRAPRLPVLLGLCACLWLSACDAGRKPAAETRAQTTLPEAGDGEHMVSMDTPAQALAPPSARRRASAHWPEAALEAGQAWVSCDSDYVGHGDGQPLGSLAQPDVIAALAPCREPGLVRVRYAGKVNAGFTELTWRVAEIADRLGIHKRILDLDSSGGQVEDAIRAGDVIGESGWTIWVREGSVCHSACVFVLAAGDNRMISGKVGIHRMMRISSKASSRAELAQELREVYDNVKAYLERNGAAVALADLMMTVPNRRLRLLGPDELVAYGLDGPNAVQDDLDRIRLGRKCGEDFVRRRDAFAAAFDSRCRVPDASLDAMNECGLGLRGEFGFPDAACKAESPMAELDACGEGGVACLPTRPQDEAAAVEAGSGHVPEPASAAGAKHTHAALP